jgi:hypothetical protein
MPIKRSAVLFITLTMSSVGLLVFSSKKLPPPVKPVNPCEQLKQTELFSPWGMMSQSMLRTSA